MTKDEELKQAKQEIKDLQNQVVRLQRENVEIYALLGAAHLNLKQHLKYGFNPATANSTLISVGQFYSKLKAEMDKNSAQEPVAWGVFEGNLHDMFFTEAEAIQMVNLKGIHAEVKPLYTTPPKREWVGLTEDQFLETARLAEDGNYLVAFQRIQQWLREGNT